MTPLKVTRPYTRMERFEVEALVRRCFTGRAREGDMARANVLMKQSLKEYREISDRVRKQERLWR